MPVLPDLFHHRDPDSRILEARQSLHHLAPKAAHSAAQFWKRMPLASRILPRQNGGILAIPTQYQGLNAGPSPGVVVGIILGSVFGFLLLIWLLWILSSGSGFIRSTALTEEDVVVRRRSRSRATTRRSRRTEMTDRSPRRERVIRQERIIRDSVPPPREPSRIRETIIMNGSRPPPERRVDGDDIVEVIEEHSSIGVPPPRRKTRRSSGYR